ncbi:cobalamin biosynthesis protein [Streptomyces sp. NPDC048650]|uniref:cobalamin biosynthesis protein n=1 Tax=Streptomyces sp. NPDC048650 TaxID=3365583 RepID=UPI0037155E8A
MTRRAAGDAGEGAAPLVVGVGASRGVPVSEVLELITATLAAAGCADRPVATLATVTARAAEPGLIGAARRLGVPLRSYPAAALATVRGADPSAAVRAAVGTPSVAEAAALLAAGPGAELIAGKRKSAPAGRPARATCALAAVPVTLSGVVTAGREGAPAAPAAAADIVMSFPNPPRRGPDRRTTVVGDEAPDRETTGTKET